MVTGGGAHLGTQGKSLLEVMAVKECTCQMLLVVEDAGPLDLTMTQPVRTTCRMLTNHGFVSAKGRRSGTTAVSPQLLNGILRTPSISMSSITTTTLRMPGPRK